jgi:hypothetical protein
MTDLNEYSALLVYLEAPHFQIDNNLVENAIRPSCVGKKRCLFIGHPQAGWRSAVIYSILQSCRRRGLSADSRKNLPGRDLANPWTAPPARTGVIWKKASRSGSDTAKRS